MKAVVYEGCSGELKVEDRPRPVPREGEVLIKVKLAGICGTDVDLASGKRKDAPAPLIPGHEFMGEVAEVCGADPNLIGKRVVAEPTLSCGWCGSCRRGYAHVCEHLQVLGVHADGAFAEYVKVPAEKVYEVPEGIPDHLAAMTEPVAVAVHVVRRANPQVGDAVMVVGGGPIGLLVAQVARFSGAGQVVVVEISSHRLNIARSLGFETLDPAGAAPDDMRGTMDVVFEVSGSAAGMDRAVRSLRPRGRLLVVGFFKAPAPVDLAQVLFKELEFRGSRVYAAEDFPRALQLISNQAVKLEPLLSHILPLSRANDGIRLAAQGAEAMKVLLDVEA